MHCVSQIAPGVDFKSVSSTDIPSFLIQTFHNVYVVLDHLICASYTRLLLFVSFNFLIKKGKFIILEKAQTIYDV